MNESELSYSYEAFISYRQVEPDKTIAERLHRALETYKVPRSLIKEGMPRRLKRIFRDKEELAASSNLGENIQKALKQDGWTTTEVFQYLNICLKDLVKVASTLEEKDGEAKADWVAEQFKEIYWEINPNIPKIPDWIETPIERLVINAIVPALVKMAYNAVFKNSATADVPTEN